MRAATQKVTLTIDEDVLATLRRLAAAAGLPLSTYVTRAAEHHARIQDGLAAVATTEAVARFAGVLLARSHTSDAVDAIVAATALAERAALVVTSDPDDLRLLLDDPTTHGKPGLLVV